MLTPVTHPIPLILVRVTAALLAGVARVVDRVIQAFIAVRHRRRGRLVGSHGQATTEYALVLLAAALVALLVVAWATSGGAAKIARLFNKVIDAVTGKV